MTFLTTAITRFSAAVAPMTKVGRAIVVPGLLLAGTAAHAGRPMTADDAAVLEPRTCQLEAWWQRLHDHREA